VNCTVVWVISPNLLSYKDLRVATFGQLFRRSVWAANTVEIRPD